MFKRLIIGITFAIFSTSIYASTYLGVVSGMGVQRVGQDNDNTPVGAPDFKYIPNKKNSTAFLFGIDGGYEFKLGSSDGLLSLGVGIYQSTNYKSTGRINEEGDPILNYQYRALSTRFMAETQFSWQLKLSETKKIIPFVTAGIGPSLNYSNGFSETPIVNSASALTPSTELTAAPTGPALTEGFPSKTKAGFAWQLGGGLAFPFNADHDRVFAAYRFVSLGRPQFGNSTTADHNWKLTTGKLRAHEIYLGYTHLF